MTPSLPNTSEIVEQLIYLRRITEITGVLHHAQVQHIKLFWGLLTDGQGTKFGLDFDNKIIEFQMPQTATIDRNMVTAFYEALEFVLGKGWAYRFMKGDEEINV